MAQMFASRSMLRVAAATAAGGVATVLYFKHSTPMLLDSSAPMPIDSSSTTAKELTLAPTRSDMLKALKGSQTFDLLVIGGGATGAGVTLDAASRGLSVAMVDRDDWSSGTSSKSTKLVHGGVRYLQKAIMELDREQWNLVKEALHERKTFLHIAPHLSCHLPIMLPVYTWWKLPYYWVGCKMYDLLAGSENMESSYLMSKGKSLEQFPMLKSAGLVGSLVYYDGQHNDSRMNMALVSTAIAQGAVAANHVEVVEIIKTNGRCSGAILKDKISGAQWAVKAKGIINATGPFTDGIRRMNDSSVQDIVAPSSGVHITLPKYYSPGSMGMLDPNTSDGRVIFFLPWQGNAIAGTTDSPSSVDQHPVAQEEEIQWVLGEVRNYLNGDIKVRRGDVLSAWSGIRPLVRNPNAKGTAGLVRSHMIDISESGLLTIAGGKWTTYRAMAQETVDAAIKEFQLQPLRPCVTERLRLVGADGWHKNLFVSLIQQFGLDTDVAKHLSENYGTLAWAVCSMASPTGMRWPVHGVRLDPSYPYIEAEVRYGVRKEMAVTATDIIARRTRLSFLNAQAALEALPRVIDIMTEELGWDSKKREEEFATAKEYLRSMGLPETMQQLSLKEIRQGKSKTMQESQVSSRAIFSTEELESLTKTFSAIDHDQNGKISASDLELAIRKAGFTDLPKDKISSVIRDLDRDSDGALDFQDFLAAASGFKELQISNALTQVADGLRQAELQGHGHAAGDRPSTQGRIPVERSGGGT